ncbi:MAG: mannose-6-phosphate isomerase [Kiritimatiellae bacterium]|nr:mannose-6-phosphate isomerase [Kiritimatiellia bacterium]
MSELYPVTFKPVYKDYIWGGDKILHTYNRDEPPGIYAESWEVSDRPEGMSVVANGALTGKTFRELIDETGPKLLGSDLDHFPLLIKIIDAHETLSVQIHPDDKTAIQYGGEAKTEMWYVLEAEPGACVYSGLKPGIDKETFQAAVKDNRVEDLLIKIPVTKEDTILTPGGRVHAIGAGCLLLEVQQNSNTTYRIYDWGRLGTDGNPRRLHLEQATQVIHWDDQTKAKVAPRKLGQLGDNERWEMLTTSHFRMERLCLKETWDSPFDGKFFHILFVAEGSVTLKWNSSYQPLLPGTSCLIPTALPTYQIEPSTYSKVIRITL